MSAYYFYSKNCEDCYSGTRGTAKVGHNIQQKQEHTAWVRLCCAHPTPPCRRCFLGSPASRAAHFQNYVNHHHNAIEYNYSISSANLE